MDRLSIVKGLDKYDDAFKKPAASSKAGSMKSRSNVHTPKRNVNTNLFFFNNFRTCLMVNSSIKLNNLTVV